MYPLEGVLSRYDKKSTIALLIARSTNRFTSEAKDRARSSEYNIILTDEQNVYSDLINFIELHPLDNDCSNNNFFFHFYNIVKILLLVFISFILVLIWLSMNQNKENVINYIY